MSKYPPKLFHSTNIKDAFKIATNKNFASLILPKQSDLDVIFNPFFNLFEESGKRQFYGHLARVNPIYEILLKNKSEQCQLVFNASDVYISPVCYKQKQTTHNVVPTWNYVAAQFKGTIQIVPKEQLYELLRKQVQIFEGGVGSQWKLTDSSQDYVQLLMSKIFGIKIMVKSWKSHMKLSQNHLEDEKKIKEWSQNTSKKSKSIVDWMSELN